MNWPSRHDHNIWLGHQTKQNNQSFYCNDDCWANVSQVYMCISVSICQLLNYVLYVAKRACERKFTILNGYSIKQLWVRWFVLAFFYALHCNAYHTLWMKLFILCTAYSLHVQRTCYIAKHKDKGNCNWRICVNMLKYLECSWNEKKH